MDEQAAINLARSWLTQPFDERHAWSVAKSIQDLLPDTDQTIFLQTPPELSDHLQTGIDAGVRRTDATLAPKYLVQLTATTVYRSVLISEDGHFLLDVDSIPKGGVVLDHITEHWTSSVGAEFRHRRWAFKYGLLGHHTIVIETEEHVNSSDGPDDLEAFARALDDGNAVLAIA